MVETKDSQTTEQSLTEKQRALLTEFSHLNDIGSPGWLAFSDLNNQLSLVMQIHFELNALSDKDGPLGNKGTLSALATNEIELALCRRAMTDRSASLPGYATALKEINTILNPIHIDGRYVLTREIVNEKYK